MVFAALAPSAAQAQTTPAQEPKPAAAQEPKPPEAPAPPPRKFSGSATVSLSLETGRTNLTVVQGQLEGKRPFSAAGSFDFNFTYARATSAPPGASVRHTVADRLTALFDVEQSFGTRLIMMLRAQALRDPIAQIRYRIGESAGLGVRLGNKRVQARVLPGVAFFNDEMHSEFDGFKVHYGLYEDITATITPAWTFAHYLAVSRNFSDPDDAIVALDARLTGAITRRLSIQLSYQYNYERRLPPGVVPEYQKTMAGLQISF